MAMGYSYPGGISIGMTRTYPTHRSIAVTGASRTGLLARIARSTGGKLLDRAAERLFPAASKAPKAAPSITRAIAGAALTRIAARSVPGAIVVGGGILAKGLYDRRRAHLARRKTASTSETSSNETGNAEA